MRPAELAEQVAALEWYHSIELAPGLVTPGWFDCRAIAPRALPASCAGLRCLDVGTYDGFWAFEMERRQAAEVIAIDALDESRWDWPAVGTELSRASAAARKAAGSGFEVAHAALGSSVERWDASVYDLDPERHGRFDLVYLGSLLLHLRDPVRALEAVRTVTAGRLIVVDAVGATLSLAPFPLASLHAMERPVWWKPNLRGLARMVQSAGFVIESGPRLVFMPAGDGMPRAPLTLKNLRHRVSREIVVACRIGDPHALLSAVPRRDL